jgi:hypothetical protein
MEDKKLPYYTLLHTNGRLLRCDRLFLSLLSKVFRLLQLFHEAVDAAFGIYQLLPAGEKRMAARADFHTEVALVGGARFEGAAAGAGHVNFVVGGMNSGFHSNKNPFSMLSVYRGHLKIQTPATPEQAMRGPVA